MTIYDFFFTQTLQEIKQCFKNVGLQKYTVVQENVNDFCKVFGLLPDKRVSYLHTMNYNKAKDFIFFTGRFL